MANQDQNLVYGWHSQKLGATAGQSGFSQPAQAPVSANVSAALQASSGAPVLAPGGATVVLENPGYASGNGTLLGTVTPPAAPATTVAIQSPYGLAALVTLTGGTISAVNTAPNANGVAGTFTQVGTALGQYTLPPAGWIKVSYTGTLTWTWTTIN